MRLEKVFTLSNQLCELSRLAGPVESFAQQAEISMQDTFSLNLVLEELITNIINYAYNDDQPHQIKLTLIFHSPHLTAQLSDDGLPFDPTSAAQLDLSSNLEDRPIGGLGIHFVREFMDTVEYKRMDGCNHLRLGKNFPGA